MKNISIHLMMLVNNDAFIQKMADILATTALIKMPRAKRANLAHANWPLLANGHGATRPQYNRAYRFAPIIAANNNEHQQRLLNAVANICRHQQSAIIFFNTIAECEAFHEKLAGTDINPRVQIFDGTALDEATIGFKPSLKTAIFHANQPRMITLTTAAGSRGADFKNVSVGILAQPGLSRVAQQKAGRIGRNMDFGIVCEIYSLEQLDEVLNSMQNSDNLLFGLDKMADAMQDRDLAALREREPLDALKDFIQEEYAALPTPNPAWPRFFASV